MDQSKVLFFLRKIRSVRCTEIARTPEATVILSIKYEIKLMSIWLQREVYKLSGCGFESRCSDLNFRFRACFEQGVPGHSGNYRMWIHSEMRTWHDKNSQLISICLWKFAFVGWLHVDVSNVVWPCCGCLYLKNFMLSQLWCTCFPNLH